MKPEQDAKLRAYWNGCKDQGGAELHALLSIHAEYHIRHLSWGYPGEWRVSLSRWPNTEPTTSTGVTLIGRQGSGSDADMYAAVQKAIASLQEDEAEVERRQQEHAERKQREAAKLDNLTDTLYKEFGL
jgi:hypothetical protein